jgi:hypothetical protein
MAAFSGFFMPDFAFHIVLTFKNYMAVCEGVQRLTFQILSLPARRMISHIKIIAP